ncbi:hypothetical protein [Arenimonas oryziterrae]|uniref:Orc1-like AAA ATPase domain-containing protein n=1 Tax=Arenimonas oryziterrae DSM 21050 = YC6267 TaxID=1121015 RepID=A0A091AZU9_9GAMM|nr:hypothetical protein [Arenimonas oryziterrae]KFN44931.1 hypothetical protein N789_02610 [Arenimonas oryziterrae DSM 21050 = YC6267]
MSLRRKLAEHGFESNDDYDHALRSLFGQEPDHLRVLHVDGLAGRRKTAFAQALGRALDYPHVLYHDFSGEEAPPAPFPVQLDDGSTGPVEPPLSGFERVMTEACAYSEAAQTLLILDQLQAAHFADQARLYHFVMKREWSNAAGTVHAHGKNLLLAVISEQPLYHSLAKCSYRVWTDAQRAFLDYRPGEFGLGVEAQGLFAAIATVCVALQAAPTPSEFAHLLSDLVRHARSEDQIRQSFFGRIENIDRPRLYSPELVVPLRDLLVELERLLGADEVILGD